MHGTKVDEKKKERIITSIQGKLTEPNCGDTAEEPAAFQFLLCFVYLTSSRAFPSPSLTEVQIKSQYISKVQCDELICVYIIKGSPHQVSAHQGSHH